MVEITLLYASLIALLFLLLSTRVIRRRQEVKAAWGDGDDQELKRRIRGQANCAEYAPLGLILMALLELNGAPGWAVHVIGILLLAGRVIHGWAFSFAGAPMGARVGGMVLTLFALGGTAVFGLVRALF